MSKKPVEITEYNPEGARQWNDSVSALTPEASDEHDRTELQQAIDEVMADEAMAEVFDAVEIVDLRPDNTRNRAEDFPQIWRETKDGNITIRQNPRHDKVKFSEQAMRAAYDYQDSAKNRYRDAEQSGHDARFGVKVGDHEIIFSKMFSDWMLTNGEIAALHRCGWFVRIA